MTVDLGALVSDWPVDHVAAVAVTPVGVVGGTGDLDWRVRIASVSKLLVSMAILVAIEEETVELDDPAGRLHGVTLRHLLAHTSGLDFDRPRLVAEVGERRVYSDIGMELAADHLAQRSGMPFVEYLTEAVVVPLKMTSTVLDGSPANDVHSSVGDLARFASELLVPTLVSTSTLELATSIHFPETSGILPGIGRFDPNPWGLGFEIKGDKSPHWSGSLTSPRTFGHFGGSGSFLWVDPEVGLASVVLTDRPFGDWAMQAWPGFSDAVLQSMGG